MAGEQQRRSKKSSIPLFPLSRLSSTLGYLTLGYLGFSAKKGQYQLHDGRDVVYFLSLDSITRVGGDGGDGISHGSDFAFSSAVQVQAGPSAAVKDTARGALKGRDGV